MKAASINKKVRLGMFIVIGVVLFTVGIYLIGNKSHLFSRTIRISGVFKDVSGLQVGNNVRFAGINVGTVDNIKIINDSSVQVDMLVTKSTQKFIKKDATIMIGTDGLMGSKLVNISPGTASEKEIGNNDFVQTVKPVSIDEIMTSIKKTSDNAAVITADLADIIDNVHEGHGAIGKLFMDSTFANNLDKTLVNVKEGAGGFKENMEAAKSNFLFKGYYKKKKKEEEKKEEEKEKEKKQKEEQKNDQSPNHNK